MLLVKMDYDKVSNLKIIPDKNSIAMFALAGLSYLAWLVSCLIEII